MKIKSVQSNNRKKCIDITTSKREFTLPYSRLRLVPTSNNKIKDIFVDKELANEAVTYVLESGKEDSIPLDAFLDYNKDPEYMKKIILYKLTLLAIEAVEKSKLSKREIARKLSTSPAQLYRLLDTANYKKTIDQMFKLLSALGYKLNFVKKRGTRKEQAVSIGI